MVKKFNTTLLHLLALGADTEKIKAVAHDFKARLPGQFLGHIVQRSKIGIHNISAFSADEMRVGERPIPIVAIPAVTKAEFQNFPNLFHDDQCLINGGETRCGEVLPDLFIYGLNAGVSVTGGQYF